MKTCPHCHKVCATNDNYGELLLHSSWKCARPNFQYKDKSWKSIQRIAHGKVLNAKKRGELQAPKHCTFINCRSRKVHGHHWKGYLPPYELDVQWLCPKHHSFVEHHPDQNPAFYGTPLAISQKVLSS